MAFGNCLHTNIQALTALFMMSWEMVREQAKIWELFFAHRKIKIPKLTEVDKETYTNLPTDELQALGVAKTMLTQATLKPAKEQYPEQANQNKCKTHSHKDCRYVKILAIYRNRE